MSKTLLLRPAILGVFSLSLLALATTLHYPAFSAKLNSTSTAVSAAETSSIRMIPFVANDIIYNPSDDKIYASVPSSVGTGGNSIQQVDPRTMSVADPVFVGSEPGRLAMANDGHTLYTALNGAYAVRRFDTATQTAGPQFSLGFDFLEQFRASDIAISPDDPNVVAVARIYTNLGPPEAGVAVFDNGVQRPQTGPGHSAGSDFLAFSSTGSTLFGAGLSSGLKNYSVNAAGVSVVTSSTLGSGARIKYSGGKIFTSAGQVIDPVAPTLLGTFPQASSIAFVPDTGVGRSYYLKKDLAVPGNWILNAYDNSTFTSVGTLVISNVLGDATSLIRWGSNGLAFPTTRGQLYIIQTDLIPSGDPIPAPSVTPFPTPPTNPTPQPFETSYRYVTVSSNESVYDSIRDKIYISVPSQAGAAGNSIGVIDPVSAKLESTIWAGSEPNKLALSNDGATLYVGLDGSRTIRPLDVSNNSFGSGFSVGNDQFDGPMTINDLAVSPDSPGLIAVSRGSSASTAKYGAAIFFNGNPYPQTRGDSSFLVFSDSSAKMYGAYLSSSPKLEILTNTADGVTGLETVPFNGGGRIAYANGLVYSSTGQVIDPNAKAMAGTFALSSPFAAVSFTVDPTLHRAFYLVNISGIFRVWAFDTNTYLYIGQIDLPGVSSPTSIKRFGTNGVVVTQSSGTTVLINSKLVDPSGPIPTTTGPPEPSSAPPPAVPIWRKVNLHTNDLLFDSFDKRLYATVPGIAGGSVGNTITRIEPVTGSMESSVFVGSEPNRLAQSTDGQTLWASLDGANAIRRFDVTAATAGLQFTPNNNSNPTLDLAVSPDNPNALVVAAGDGGAAIYDNGVKRPNIPKDLPNPVFTARIGKVGYSNSASKLYGYNNNSTGADLYGITVNAAGLTSQNDSRNLIAAFITDVKFADGKAFSSDGRVVDPEANRILGTFGASGSAIAVDVESHKAFIASRGVISVFDTDTYLNIGRIQLPSDGDPNAIVRWGSSGLALRIVRSIGNSYVFILRSSIVGAIRETRADFDGDGKTDVTVYRPDGGFWFSLKSGGGGALIQQWGEPGDIPTPGDFDGDGKADIAVYRPSVGLWFILRSSDSTLQFMQWGVSTDIPVAADFDGDGKTDVAVYRPDGGYWFVLRSSDSALQLRQWGDPGDIPVVGDYDGDNHADVAIYRPNGGFWFVLRSSDSALQLRQWGEPGDQVIPGDFDGDGKTDVAVYRPNGGFWFILRSSDSALQFMQWGEPGDIPTPGDFDGDGRDDIAVLRPQDGNWFIMGSTSGFQLINWAVPGDIPIPPRSAP